MTLAVDITHRRGDFKLAAKFESAGPLTALFGSSGSGKTTLLNTIAGLLTPDEGRIAVDEHVLFDSALGINPPVHRRGLGYVFQESRLFPHLNVQQNLLFGRQFTPRSRRLGDLRSVCELLGIAHLLQRRPQALSGGEKQRVAIGRALLASPRLLLMDEPMAALDDERKTEILPYIERLRDEVAVPIVYVSHSVAEVSRLANYIVLLDEGRMTAAGPAGEVLGHLALLPPALRREGGSLLAMTIAAYDAGYDMTMLASPAGEAHVPGHIGETGASVRLRIRAHDVILASEEPISLSALNIFRGSVTMIDGDAPLYVTVDCHGQPVVAAITRQSRDRLELVVGQAVYVIVKALAVEGGGALVG